MESASEDHTLKKYASDDQNLSQSKRNDQGDSDTSLFISEPTLSREDLKLYFFIKSAEIQLLISFVAKDFQTSLHKPWLFGETS